MNIKTSLKLALVAAAGLAGSLLLVQAQNDPAAPPAASSPSGAPAGRPNPGTHLLNLLEKYDANHDGQLDKDEMAAFRKDIEEGKIPRPPGGPGRNGPGGPGQREQGMKDGQAPARPTPEALLAQFDTDKDGKLSAAELGALLKDLEAHRPHPGRRGLGHPHGPEGGDDAGAPQPGEAPEQP